MTFSLNFKTVGKWLGILALVGTFIIGGWWTAKKVWGEGSTPEGTISIPTDLLKEYEPAAAEWDAANKIIEEQKKRIEKVQPLIEQTLRITLDRANIKPADWGKYEFDPVLKGFKPRPAPSPAK